jgi:hypothetical protein
MKSPPFFFFIALNVFAYVQLMLKAQPDGLVHKFFNAFEPFYVSLSRKGDDDDAGDIEFVFFCE